MSFKVMLTQDEFLKKIKDKDIKYIPLEWYRDVLRRLFINE